MSSKRDAMARLYADRLRRGTCLTCDRPAHPYARCEDCRADQADEALNRRILRRMTAFTILTLSVHSST